MAKHKLHKCGPDCEGCMFCDGGLALCEVCRGGEAELPTECPGRVMTDEEREDVEFGRRNFIGGQWRELAPAKGSRR